MFKRKIILKGLYTLLFLFIFSLSSILAQQDSRSLINQYLDDGNRSTTTDVLKTDISEILKGNISIIWEHKMNDFFQIESGVGLLTSQFYKPLFRAIYPRLESVSRFDFKTADFRKMNSGYSLYFSPRITSFIGYEGLYLSQTTRFSHYLKQLGQLEIGIMAGYKWMFTDKLVADISTGLSVDQHWSLDGNYYLHKTILPLHQESVEKPNSTYFTLPIHFTIGYKLN